MGEEPKTKAAIFQVANNPFRLTIRGAGQLPRADSGGGGGDSISILPAAVHNQFWMILGFAAAILGLGFYGFYTASTGPPPTAAVKTAPKRKK